MQVRCIHCGHGFDHEAPSFARGAATTVCPSCGRDTPATEEWLTDTGFSAGGAAVESRVYCFNCGCAMTPREGELIPVCDNCRQDQNAGAGLEDELPESDEPVADWMIRKANGNVYGPFPTETIVDWIRAKKINADEEIAHIGGAWRLFGQHEEFGKFFDSPADTGQQSASEIDFRRKTPVKDALGRFGAAPWRVVDNGVSTTPDSTLSILAELEAPVALLVGGRSKGQDLTALTAAAAKRCARILCFGEAADELAAALAGAAPTLTTHPTVEAAVTAAFATMAPDETLLFSPACSSFDAYNNFQERAHAFRAALPPA